MTGLIPFNRRGSNLARTGAGFEDFYNILDDFFSDGLLSSRSLARDTFKIDVRETEKDYVVEAELPGAAKDEISLGVEDDSLCISVNRAEEDNDEGKNYIHRERRASSMSRRLRLMNARLADVKAKLEDGVLVITVPKAEKTDGQRRIEIA